MSAAALDFHEKLMVIKKNIPKDNPFFNEGTEKSNFFYIVRTCEGSEKSCICRIERGSLSRLAIESREKQK